MDGGSRKSGRAPVKRARPDSDDDEDPTEEGGYAPSGASRASSTGAMHAATNARLVLLKAAAEGGAGAQPAHAGNAGGRRDADLTPEERAEQRKQRNRESAALSRGRSRAYIKALEDEVARLQARVSVLEGGGGGRKGGRGRGGREAAPRVAARVEEEGEEEDVEAAVLMAAAAASSAPSSSAFALEPLPSTRGPKGGPAKVARKESAVRLKAAKAALEADATAAALVAAAAARATARAPPGGSRMGPTRLSGDSAESGGGSDGMEAAAVSPPLPPAPWSGSSGGSVGLARQDSLPPPPVSHTYLGRMDSFADAGLGLSLSNMPVLMGGLAPLGIARMTSYMSTGGRGVGGTPSGPGGAGDGTPLGLMGGLSRPGAGRKGGTALSRVNSYGSASGPGLRRVTSFEPGSGAGVEGAGGGGEGDSLGLGGLGLVQMGLGLGGGGAAALPLTRMRSSSTAEERGGGGMEGPSPFSVFPRALGGGLSRQARLVPAPGPEPEASPARSVSARAGADALDVLSSRK